jgi:predicted GNAT family acetyltransferase
VSLDALTVRDNPTERRYELVGDGEVLGWVSYIEEPEGLGLAHTEVDRRQRRQGLGSRLVAGVLDDLRSRGVKPIPYCAFVRWYLSRHPEAV